MKTVSCPSCGASATNHQNCEFCGSLFVRYEGAGMSPNEIFINNSFTGFSFPGLSDHLKMNLDSQTQDTFMVTDVMKGNDVLLQIVQSSGAADMLPGGNFSSPGIAVHLPFDDTQSIPNELNFKTLEEHKLFKLSNNMQGIKDYAIDYGNDSVGAAYLSSKLLQTLFYCAQSDALTFNTSDYSNTDTKSGGCFIATATMGDYDHPDVVRLRKFRDEWIIKQDWGVDFVNWYYKNGQKPAESIRNNKFLKLISYLFIVKPLLVLSRVFSK